MTVDFAWPRFEKCSISSMPSPAFTLKGVPAATVRLSFALTKDEDRRELGGTDIVYSPGLKLPAGSFYLRAPCLPGTYRWTVIAEGVSGKTLATASKALPLP